jgi:hypothetical protein
MMAQCGMRFSKWINIGRLLMCNLWDSKKARAMTEFWNGRTFFSRLRNLPCFKNSQAFLKCQLKANFPNTKSFREWGSENVALKKLEMNSDQTRQYRTFERKFSLKMVAHIFRVNTIVNARINRELISALCFLLFELMCSCSIEVSFASIQAI